MRLWLIEGWELRRCRLSRGGDSSLDLSGGSRHEWWQVAVDSSNRYLKSKIGRIWCWIVSDLCVCLLPDQILGFRDVVLFQDLQGYNNAGYEGNFDVFP